MSHLRAATTVLFGNGTTTLVVVALLSTSVVFSFLLQVDQLWPLALKLGVIWYGPLNAFLLLGYSIGVPLAHLLLKRPLLIKFAYLLAIISVACLTIPYMPVVVVAQFGVICLFIALNTLMLGRLHDILPAHMRSLGSSAVSTLGTLAFMPALFVFSSIVQHYSIFIAAAMLVPIAVLGIVVILLALRQANIQPHKLLI